MTTLVEEVSEVRVGKRDTTFTNDFSKEVWEETYQYRETDKDINDTHLRVAIDIASVEQTEELRNYWANRFADILEDFKFVPGGRITSNAGTRLEGTTMINCFVDGAIGEYQDSMEGILGALHRQALILKSEGGYGFCADFMRPRGAFIHAIGNETPGAVEMLRMWDTQSAVITQGSGRKMMREKGKKKIRKGAQMVTMSCFSKNTDILTSKGWINIVDLCNRFDNDESFEIVTESGILYPMEASVRNPPQEVYTIETETGEILEVTADHKFLVHNIKTDEEYLKPIAEVDFEKEELVILEKEE